jgi:hypothetical protein
VVRNFSSNSAVRANLISSLEMKLLSLWSITPSSNKRTWMSAGSIVYDPHRWPRPLARRGGGEPNVPKFNEQKKTLDQKTPSDQEVWSAIRYLDIEIDERPSTRKAIIALAAALLIICVTVWVLRARRL